MLRRATAAGSAAAVLATAHTAFNLRQLRRPQPLPADRTIAELVSVLLPVRDEADKVSACLKALLAQESLDRVEVLVLDDGSTDGTADRVRDEAGGRPGVRLISGPPEPPAGWLGKPWACARLADAARGSVLVFVDADVVLAPGAVAATVDLLRSARLDLVSPYPRQLAVTWSERLVQPLLQWSWLATLPLGVAERSSRPSLAAANGQFLAVDAAAYRRAGGHGAVRAAVLDDVELLRAVKRTGGRGTVVDGTQLATCRMYHGWTELEAGYAKSLWAAFGSPAGAAAVTAGLGVAFVLPFAAALRGSKVGLVGYAAAVAGRVLVARRVGGRVWPDSLAHPASVAVLGVLTSRSLSQHRAGTLTWKGRRLP
jgi:Glycosyl transferase family 2